MMMTKQDAATQQIEAAISLLRAGNYPAAITLGQAAANCIPGSRDLWEKMQGVYEADVTDKPEKAADWLNAPANWLKHSDKVRSRAPEFEISKGEATINVWRGIATYADVYGQDKLTPIMEDFMRNDWQRQVHATNDKNGVD